MSGKVDRILNVRTGCGMIAITLFRIVELFMKLSVGLFVIASCELYDSVGLFVMPYIQHPTKKLGSQTHFCYTCEIDHKKINM